jgi:hypothetical protein
MVLAVVLLWRGLRRRRGLLSGDRSEVRSEEEENEK